MQGARFRNMRRPFRRFSVGIAACAVLLQGCATSPGIPSGASSGIGREAIEAAYGVRVEAVRLSADRFLIDLRYRILDVKKAAPLLDRRVKLYLIDQETGVRLPVPSTAKVGPLRQTVKFGQGDPGRIYFILFTNTGRVVRPGGKVTFVAGEFRARDLVVE
ncbi:MAG: hypothetical protein Kow00128_22190 [Deltaproteobacteria bacterium]